jgi:hypothetical protein
MATNASPVSRLVPVPVTTARCDCREADGRRCYGRASFHREVQRPDGSWHACFSYCADCVASAKEVKS